MSKDLIALLSDREIGRVVQDQRGKLKFTYDEAGREARGAYCFSRRLHRCGRRNMGGRDCYRASAANLRNHHGRIHHRPPGVHFDVRSGAGGCPSGEEWG